jgi:N-methylhydantoinase A/oxoprolinase/acetone carboxylase beta subunit
MYSIDIDIGGTFTDGFFTDGVEVRTEKVLTTPHDITECFVNCVVAGARAFGLDTSEFLRRSSVARVSTTVGTNLLVQRIGPRLGLIVTKGHEKFLYGNENNLVLDQYLPADMVVGVGEEVNDRGVVVREVEAANLLAAVRQLIAASARMIVISFRNAWRNPHNERLARALIRERYPVHYLRSVPLQIGTEVIHVADDEARTNSAVLNAYIHAEMARALYRAEDRLREAGFLRPLLVVHASGGSARVAKTVALHTLNSGPAAAAKGAAHLARLFGDTRVIATDMGGTSFDLSLIVDGQPIFSLLPELDGIRIATPMIEVDALGAGGGSIARLDGRQCGSRLYGSGSFSRGCDDA